MDLNDPPVEKVVTVLDAVTYKVLGHVATPRLLSVTSDGTPALAWEYEGAWRVADDKFDAQHKPADVDYTRVLAGLMPRRTRDTMPGRPQS